MIDARRRGANRPHHQPPSALGRLAAAVAAAACWAGGVASAQGPPEDFVNPILTMSVQGHTDLIQALAFTPDGSRILTGGRDKVVHVWALDRGRPALESSIRPPMRRRGGRVYAVAVSPRADAQGRRLVAVAGMGALGSRGGILLYRLGRDGSRESGDLAFELPPGSAGDPAERRRGHGGSVSHLAFSPDGTRLASCGNEFDRTIRIWELGESPRTLLVLQGHVGEVKAAEFLDDARLVSVGGPKDGSIRLWDARDGRPLLAASPSAADLAKDGGRAAGINALAVSPGGRDVVVGREDGRLERYDGADLGRGAILNRDALAERPADEPGGAAVRPRRAIEALACSPDGRTLAVSVLKQVADRREVAAKDCDVELRSLPDGGPLGLARSAGGLVMALAFSPDGKYLAMGGGDRQELALRDMADPARVDPDLRADGPGTMLWDVAFVDAKPTVAFRRSRAGGAAGAPWETFDLRGREFGALGPEAGVRGSLTTLDGWRFRSLDFDAVEFLPSRGDPLRIAITPSDVRWSSYTFIPADAAAGHPAPCAAVGTEDGGILVYNLRDRTRSRVFLGHGGAIHAMAPSPDGRWLASCSADMTVALWPLAGCDAPPPLGAALAADPQGRAVVRSVAPRSAAARLGLRPGDAILGASRTSRPGPLDVARLDAEVAAIPPDLTDQIALQVLRAGDARPQVLATSRADTPALSLFAAPDREWVVWMPEGYYETSIAGDRRLIGWHVNHVDATNPADLRSRPSDFHPMSRFEAQLRRPAVIDALLTTGDPVAALATVQGPPVVLDPPAIRLIAPAPAAAGAEVVAAGPDLNLQVEAEASAGRRVRSIVVHNGPRRLAPRVADPPIGTFRVEEPIRLGPDRNVVTVEAVDDQGVRAVQDFTILLAAPEPPPPPRRDPRLVVRAIGVEDFGRRDPDPIPHARSDAEALAAFFPKPDGRSRFSESAIDARAVADPDAEQVAALFRELADDVRLGRLKAGDTLVVSVESRLFRPDEGGALVLASSRPGDPASAPGASAAAIAEALEEAASQGCFVLVLLDALHPGDSRETAATFREWVRDLANRRGVVAMVASKQEPGERLDSLGAFAQAVVDSTTVAGGPGSRPGAPVTLQDFRSAVVRRVSELTSRRQFADLFPPEAFAGWRKVRPFDPQPTPADDLVRR